MATETTERVRRPGIDPADLQATAHLPRHVARRDRPAGALRAAEASAVGGAPKERAREALRAAATAGGVAPAPLGGRALVLPVIGRERARVEAWRAGAAAQDAPGGLERRDVLAEQLAQRRSPQQALRAREPAP